MRRPINGPELAGSVAATPILNHTNPTIVALIAQAQRQASTRAPVAVLEAAHAIIRSEVRAMYAMEETAPASRTFGRGFGSCSADFGYFTHRDDAFAQLGQTLRTPIRQLADPILRRFAA